MKIFSLCILFLFYSVFTYGQEEYFDISFGNNGRVVYDFGQNHSEFGTILSHQNSLYGFIFYTGENNLNQIIVKYDSEGNLDNSFNNSGYVVTNLKFNFWDWRTIFHGYLGLTNDNKIIAVTTPGNDDPFMGKFNLDGSLDTTYGTDGYAYTSIFESNIRTLYVNKLENDDIIIVGSEISQSNVVITKFNNQGELITEFGENGIIRFEYDHNQKEPIQAIFIENENSLYVAWDHDLDGSISKYDLNNLSLDTQFGENGQLEINVSNDKNEVIQRFNINQNGELFVAYFEDLNNHEGSFIINYDEQQMINTDFGNQGRTLISDDLSIFTKKIYLTDNFIYIIGEVDFGSTQFIKRLNLTGNFDLDFGNQGTILRSNFNGDYLVNWVFDINIEENSFITCGSCTIETGLYPNSCLNKFIINPDLSIEGFNSKNFGLYPNPSNKFINVVHDNFIKKIEIYNALGELIMLPKLNQDKIDISELEKGVYFLKILDNKKNVYKTKFIKK